VDEAAPGITGFEVQVEDVPEYHVYENGRVPPDGFAVSIMLWLLSIVGVGGVTAFADNAGLTVIRSVGEFAVDGEVAESVT